MTAARLIIVNPKERQQMGMLTFHDGSSIGNTIQTAVKTKQLTSFDIASVSKLLQKGVKNSCHDEPGDFRPMEEMDTDWSWVLSIGTKNKATVVGFGYSDIVVQNLLIP